MLIFVEIALCLALIYALGALICSVIHEAAAQCFDLRWKNLHRALVCLLEDADYAKLMAHPLIKDLWDEARKPTAIPSTIVAKAIIHAGEPDGEVLTDAQKLLDTMSKPLQRQIIPFVAKDAPRVEDLYQAAQTWFDTSMTAASDWYARQAHWLSIVVAIAFAFALNIDTVAIGTKLAQDPIRRAALTQVAEQTAQQYQADPASICPGQDATIDPSKRLSTCLSSLTDAGGDLIGWNKDAVKQLCSWGVLMQIVGWLASGLAMSLGARFWFDVLSKLISVRAGLAPKDVAKASAKS